MKCTMCDNHYVIRTDPKNLDYEIVSGARRQERRWDSTQNGQVVPDLKETTNRLVDDAMFKLEHGDADKGKKKDAEPRIRDLAEIQGQFLLAFTFTGSSDDFVMGPFDMRTEPQSTFLSDRVKDDYLANRILRDDFRVKKKADKAQKVVDDALRKKSSLDIELVPEHKDDIKTASLIKFQAAESSEERQSKKRASIEEESVFRAKSRKVFRAKEGAASKKERSRKNLVGLVNQHRIKTAIEKTTSNPMRNIGVVLRRTSSKSSESSDPEPVPSTSCSSPSTESSRSEALETSGLGSLCDYGSTSSDSD